eukprot:TRINITY_DN6324_c0_g1_i1.p1 TRINITY_DN6324_c0_g1~~TRINITY_DN6324_c0_g1_i1.p1  ORF type:complete len:115 (+),score=3.16 TRINITY_DN6324_c0_g1_i1:307-651(+)
MSEVCWRLFLVAHPFTAAESLVYHSWNIYTMSYEPSQSAKFCVRFQLSGWGESGVFIDRVAVQETVLPAVSEDHSHEGLLKPVLDQLSPYFVHYQAVGIMSAALLLCLVAFRPR